MGSGAAAAPAKNVHFASLKFLRAGHEHFLQVHPDALPSKQCNATLSQHQKDGLHVFVAQGTQFVVNDRCVYSPCFDFFWCDDIFCAQFEWYCVPLFSNQGIRVYIGTNWSSQLGMALTASSSRQETQPLTPKLLSKKCVSLLCCVGDYFSSHSYPFINGWTGARCFWRLVGRKAYSARNPIATAFSARQHHLYVGHITAFLLFWGRDPSPKCECALHLLAGIKNLVHPPRNAKFNDVYIVTDLMETDLVRFSTSACNQTHVSVCIVVTVNLIHQCAA